MKVAWVLPSYGPEVVSGAQRGARLLAEHVAVQPGWDVEVVTTTAGDAVGWTEEHAAGESVEGGVRVRRIPTRPSRIDDDPQWARQVMDDPEHCSRLDAERWIDLQGPATPEFVDAVGASDADVFVFKPYLFSTTVRPLPLVADRAVLETAAHDEPAIRLPAFDDVFTAPAGFLYNTDEERRLVEHLFPVAEKPALVLGIGVEAPPDGEMLAETEVRAALDLGDDPYLVCLGRVEGGKGSWLLTRYFAEFQRRHGTALRLVLIGPIRDRSRPLPPGVTLAGVVDEATKWAALRGATALVAPSPFESFSMAVTEAWSIGKPVLVNGRCVPTVARCRRTGAGLWFDDYATFEVALELLLERPDLRRSMGERGREEVETRYSWSRLAPRLCRFLEQVANRAD